MSVWRAVGARFEKIADTFAPPDVGPWQVRRVRLLVAIAFGLCLFAFPLAVQLYATVGGINPTIVTFIVGSVAMAANPFILRRTGSLDLAATLVCTELIVILGIQTFFNGGIASASLVWLTTVPLLAMVLLGPRASGVCALAVTVQAVGFYAAGEAGFVFPQPLSDDQMTWWHMAGLATVPLFVALVAGIGESARHAAQQRSQAAVDELREANEDLREARDRAHAAAEAKSAFLANMSHEIRTPLNAVIGMSQLLEQGGLSRRQKEMVDTVIKSGDALLALVNDILDLSKIEAGQLALETAPIDLRRCVEDAVVRAAAAAASKPIEVGFFVGDEVPDTLVTDATRLGQILLNLVSNAVKFTNVGTVTVAVSAHEAGDGEVSLEIAVRDTGIGIPADKLDDIFESFTQVDASTTRVFGGTGLGLAIVRRLVDSLGGTIEVDSEVDAGTTFTVRLAAAKAPHVPVHIPRVDWQDKRVLVVDDTDLNRRHVRQLLAGRGLSAVVTSDAGEAKAAAASEAFDLAIVDLELGDTDGAALADALAPTPALLMTTLHHEAKRGDALAGYSRIHKPIRRDALLDAVTKKLEGRPDMTEPRLAAPREVPTMPALEILIAEDNRTNQRVAVAMLARLGYEADVVADGEAVLTALAKKSYDVVLMDLQMPKLGGLEVTQQLLAKDEPPPYIVALTANALPEDRARCREAGMHDYIAKPARLDALRRVLERCIRARGSNESGEHAIARASRASSS